MNFTGYGKSPSEFFMKFIVEPLKISENIWKI